MIQGERIADKAFGHNLAATISTDNKSVHLRQFPDGKLLQKFTHEKVFTATIRAKSGSWKIHRPLSEIETWKKEMLAFRQVGEPTQPSISGATFSPDGTRLVTWTDSHIHASVWDTANGDRVFNSKTLEIESAAFAPSGKFLVTGGKDGKLIFYDPVDGTVLSETEKGEQPIDLIKFSPDGRYFVTNSRLGSARLWDAWTMEPRGSPFPNSTMHLVSEFSPDSKKLYLGTNRNEIEIWATDPVEKIGAFVRHGAEITGLFVHPENEPDGYPLISTSSDLTARILPEPHRTIDGIKVGGEISSIDFLDGSRRLVIGSEDEFVRTGTLDNEGTKYEPDKAFKAGGILGLLSCKVSPDGKLAACGNLDGEGNLMDLETGKIVGKPFHHDQMIHSVAFSPDGKKVVTGSFDGTAKMWSVPDGEFLDWEVDHDSQIYSTTFSPDGKIVVTGGGKGFKKHAGFVRFWDAESGNEIHLSNNIQNETIVTSVLYGPGGGKFIFTSIDKTAKILDAKSGALLYILPHSDAVFCAAVNSSGTLLATGCNDKTVSFWDLESGMPFGTEPNTYPDQVKRLTFLPDKPVIAVGCDNGSLHFTRYPEAKLPTLDVGELRLWIEVRTGLFEDEEGILQRLPQKEWEERADRWRKLHLK